MAYEHTRVCIGEGEPVVVDVTNDWSGTVTGFVFLRRRHLNELVRDAAEHGLYESTSEPRDTR